MLNTLFFRRTDAVLLFRGPATLYAVVTVVLQFYCNSHILYCKWQEYKKDKERISERNVRNVPRILVNVRPMSGSINERSVSVSASNQTFNLNNLPYNKILADAKHIICLFIITLFFLTSKPISNNILYTLDSKSIHNESKILLYILDFGSKILLSFMYPLMFYISHKELRTYWKNAFSICCRNQS